MNRSLKARIIEQYGKQWVFAKALAQSESIVSKVVQGQKELSPEEKMKWAQALGCDADRIFRSTEQ